MLKIGLYLQTCKYRPVKFSIALATGGEVSRLKGFSQMSKEWETLRKKKTFAIFFAHRLPLHPHRDGAELRLAHQLVLSAVKITLSSVGTYARHRAPRTDFKI